MSNSNDVSSVTGGGAFPPERKLNEQNISLEENLQVEPSEVEESSNSTGSNVLKDDIVNLSTDRES
jgi:hypothetical protein